MAKKEANKNSATKDLDSELDFDDFSFDDIDAKVNKSNKKRGVITDTFKGTVGGMKESVFSKSTATRILKSTLPSSYGDVLNSADEISKGTAQIYGDTVRELKPTVNRIAREVDKLVPGEMQRTKGLLGKLKKITGSDNIQSTDAATIREQGINNSLAEIFKVNIEQDVTNRARDKSEETIRDRLNEDRHKSNFSMLNSISMSANRLVQYNDKINVLYQKKSLELQLRSYYTQVDTLENTKRFFEIFKNQNDAIVKNTALPEYVKITTSESAKQMLRNKFMGGVGNAMFGHEGLIKKGFQKVGAKVKDKVSDAKNALEAGLMGVEAMRDQKEMNEAMGENSSFGNSIGKNFIGPGIIDSLANKVGLVLNKKFAAKGSKIEKFGNKANTAVKDLPGSINAMLKSDRLQETGDGSIADLVKGSIRGFLSSFLPDKPSMKLENINNNNLHTPAIFDNSTKKSIVEVIPGYLARMLREIQWTRTGKDGGLTLYDFTKGKFSGKAEVVKSMKEHLLSKADTKGLGNSEDELVKVLKGEQEITRENEEALRKVIRSMSKANEGFRADNFMDMKHRKDLSPEQSKFISSHGSKAFSYTRGLGAKNHELENEFTSKAVSHQSKYNDIREQIQNAINSGQEDTLPPGLVKRDKNNDLVIDETAYRKFLESDADSNRGLVTSDYNAKKNIKGVDGKGLLNKYRQIGSKSWDYKEGKGDGGAHIGPMAQDVKKHFGDDIAPDGKAIDLISLNGANMSAIGQLSKEQEALKGGSKGSSDTKLITNAIGRSAAAIIKKLDEVKTGLGGTILGSIGSLNPHLSIKEAAQRFKDAASYVSGKAGEAKNISKTFLGKISDKLKEYGSSEHTSLLGRTAGIGAHIGALGLDTLDLIKDKLKLGKDKLKDNVINPGIDKAKDLYSKHKDPVKDKALELYEQALHLGKKGYAFGKEKVNHLVNNIIPAGVLSAKNMFNNGKEAIYNLIDAPEDIYVKGNPTPVLRATIMKVGGYRLQETGKVISHPRMVTGPVIDNEGNVVLSMEDIGKGLVDKDGKELKHPFTKLATALLGKTLTGFNFLSGAAKNLLDSASNKGGPLLKSVKDFFGSIGKGLGSNKTTDLLTEIRDMLNDRMPGEKTDFTKKAEEGSRGSSGGSTSLGGIKASIMGTVDKVKGMYSDAMNTEAGQTVKDKATSVYGSLKDKFDAKVAEHKATQETKNPKLTGLAQKEKEIKARNAPTLKNKARNIFNKVGGKSKSMFGLAGGMLSGLASKFGSDKTEEQTNDPDTNKPVEQQAENSSAAQGNDIINASKKHSDGLDKSVSDMEAAKQKRNSDAKAKVDLNAKYKSGGGGIIDSLLSKAKGIFDVISGGAGMLGKLIGFGGKALGFGSKIASMGGGVVGTAAKGIGTVARLGFSAARFAIPLLAEGGLASVMGIGGTALGMLGAAGGAILSAIASPVVLGAAAVALACYGAYKGYKYITQDNATTLDNIRLAQYGLTKDNNQFNHYIFNLEGILNEGMVGYTNGKAFLMEGKIDLKEITKVFGITPDSDNFSSFLTWFNKRFKPVFLTHLTALFAANNKVKLSSVNSLKDDEKLKYVTAATFDEGPYDVTNSPFKELGSMSAGKDYVKNAITVVLDELKKTTGKDKGKDGKPALPPTTEVEKARKAKAVEDNKVKVAAALAKAGISSKSEDLKKDDKTTDTSKAVDTTTTPSTAPSGNSERSYMNKYANGGSNAGDSSTPPHVLTPDEAIRMANPASGDLNAIKGMIADVSKTTGVDTGMLNTFAVVESSMNPNAKASTSSAKGMYQFLDGTWKDTVSKFGGKYGLTLQNSSPMNVQDSTQMVSELIKSNVSTLKGVKPKVNVVDAYLAHFLGAGGAKKFLAADGNAIAAQVLPDAAKANVPIFYKNGKALTISEVYSEINTRLQKKGKGFGVDVPTFAFSDNKATGSGSDTAPSGAGTATAGIAAGGGEYSSNTSAASIAPKVNNVASNGGSYGPQNTVAPKANSIAPSTNSSNNSSSVASTPARQVDSPGNNSLSSMEQALTKSIDIQSNMLSVLQDILKGMSPENITALMKSASNGTLANNDSSSNNRTGPLSTQGVQNRSVTPGAIDLSRRVT